MTNMLEVILVYIFYTNDEEKKVMVTSTRFGHLWYAIYSIAKSR